MAFVLMCALLLGSISLSMTTDCFVGSEKYVDLTKGFEYCSTTLNRKIGNLSYSGHNGATKAFDRESHDITVNDCFTEDIFNIEENITCYCQDDRCNPQISVETFAKLVFQFDEESTVFIQHDGDLRSFLDIHGKKQEEEQKEYKDEL